MRLYANYSIIVRRVIILIQHTASNKVVFWLQLLIPSSRIGETCKDGRVKGLCLNSIHFAVVVGQILDFLLIPFLVSDVNLHWDSHLFTTLNIKLDIRGLFVLLCFQFLSIIFIKSLYHALPQIHALVDFKSFSPSFLPGKCQQLLLIIKEIVSLFV